MRGAYIRPGTRKVYAVRNNEPWTQEEEKRLLELNNARTPHRKIADILQREYSKIVSRLNFLRYKNR